MSQGEYRVRYAIEDKASPILQRMAGAASLTSDEFFKLLEDVEGLGNRLVRTSPALAAYGQSFDEMGQHLGLSSDKLTELNRKLTRTSDALEEQTQKILDARNKLDEYGATQEEQNRIIGTLLANQGKYNLTIGKQALVLEELAIELQDATLAEKHLGAALEYTAKVGGRAEDAIATYTEALKGDTAALAKIGPVARAATANLDQIRDRQARAAETMRIFTQETTRAPDALDKLNDSYNIGAARVQMFWARLGILGPVLLSVAGGVVALAAGLGKIAWDTATEGLQRYIERNKEAAKLQKLNKEAVEGYEEGLGRVIYKQTEYGEASKLATAYQGRLIEYSGRLLVATTNLDDAWGDATASGLSFGERYQRIGLAVNATSLAVLGGPGLIGKAVGDLNQAFLAHFPTLQRYRQTLLESLPTYTLVRDGIELVRDGLDGQFGQVERADKSLKGLTNTTRVLAHHGEFLSKVFEGVAGNLHKITVESQKASPNLDALTAFGTTGTSVELGKGAYKRGGGGGVSKRDPLGAAGDVLGLRTVQLFQGRADATGEGASGIRTLEKLAGVLGALATSVDRLAASSGLEDVATAAGRAQTQGDLRRTSDFNERAGILRDVGAERLSEDLGIGDIFTATAPQLDAARAVREQVVGLGEDLSQLATGAMAQATTGSIKLFAALGTGAVKVKDFGAAFLGTMGEILTQAGEGMVLLGLGALQIKAGIVNPAALIAIGAGAIIAGEALGAASQSGSGKGSGGSAGSVTRDAFRESTDRFLEERRGERQAIVIYNYIGEEQIDGPVARAVQRAERQGFLGGRV